MFPQNPFYNPRKTFYQKIKLLFSKNSLVYATKVGYDNCAATLESIFAAMTGGSFFVSDFGY
jgi:hypothetical protein